MALGSALQRRFWPCCWPNPDDGELGFSSGQPQTGVSPQTVGMSQRRPGLNGMQAANITQAIETSQAGSDPQNVGMSHSVEQTTYEIRVQTAPVAQTRDYSNRHSTCMQLTQPDITFHPQSAEHNSIPTDNVQSSANTQPAQLSNPNPGQTLNRCERRSHAKKTTKAAIKIAFLNMKGHGSLDLSSTRNKWMHINQIMRDEKIGVLLLQETHMNEMRHDKTQKLFWKRLKIFSSGKPENPTRKGE